MASKSEKTFWQRQWKLILNIVTIVALIGLAYAIRHQLVETFANLAKVQVWALLLLIPIEYFNYDTQARMYQALFRIVGNKLTFWPTLKLTVELNFVNSVFPSGGVSGISYFGIRMRNQEITATRATLIQLMKLVMMFLSFEILIICSVIFLAAVGKANNLAILVAGSLATAMIIGTMSFVYIIGSRSRIKNFFTVLTKFLNKLIHMFRPHQPETINVARVRRTFEDLHNNYVLFRKDYKQLAKPFWWALLANLFEVLAVYVVFIAFGHWVNLGAVILAYGVANIAGFISVLPGGVGVYEALMTGVLAIAGVPASISIPAIVMYRILNTLLQLPPGYFFYQRSIRGDGLARDDA